MNSNLQPPEMTSELTPEGKPYTDLEILKRYENTLASLTIDKGANKDMQNALDDVLVDLSITINYMEGDKPFLWDSKLIKRTRMLIEGKIVCLRATSYLTILDIFPSALVPEEAIEITGKLKTIKADAETKSTTREEEIRRNYYNEDFEEENSAQLECFRYLSDCKEIFTKKVKFAKKCDPAWYSYTVNAPPSKIGEIKFIEYPILEDQNILNRDLLIYSIRLMKEHLQGYAPVMDRNELNAALQDLENFDIHCTATAVISDELFKEFSEYFNKLTKVLLMFYNKIQSYVTDANQAS